LKNVTVHFPLERLIAVTGVSGAGKSSLVRGTLLPALKNPKSRVCRKIDGTKLIEGAYEVDQSPIGKTPRSCPATYVGVWDEIRKLFATTPLARMRGYSASRFSFNTSEGRCETCEGQGRVRLKMNFLPDVYVPFETCNGARFSKQTLVVIYRENTIADVLSMSVEEAVQFFSFDSKISLPLQLLNDTGLGYLSLGQSSPTLSGGEAQRLKLVTELMRGRMSTLRQAAAKKNLYVLEEPTIGLHFADVERLILVLHRLVDAGHTVVVVEHHMNLIAEADYVIDLGPDGGEKGGRIIATGTPEEIAASKISETGRFLKSVLNRK
jgi:excinuclease ABC subunit A